MSATVSTSCSEGRVTVKISKQAGSNSLAGIVRIELSVKEARELSDTLRDATEPEIIDRLLFNTYIEELERVLSRTKDPRLDPIRTAVSDVKASAMTTTVDDVAA